MASEFRVYYHTPLHVQHNFAYIVPDYLDDKFSLSPSLFWREFTNLSRHVIIRRYFVDVLLLVTGNARINNVPKYPAKEGKKVRFIFGAEKIYFKKTTYSFLIGTML